MTPIICSEKNTGLKTQPALPVGATSNAKKNSLSEVQILFFPPKKTKPDTYHLFADKQVFSETKVLDFLQQLLNVDFSEKFAQVSICRAQWLDI